MDLKSNHFVKTDKAFPNYQQWEIDESNMKKLNDSNRVYRKCFSGKCPPVNDTLMKKKQNRKRQNFLSKQLQDEKLGTIWVNKGRGRRLKVLEAELKELKTKIAVASGKTHHTEQEKNFQKISMSIKNLEAMDKEIYKAKIQIGHLKSQFSRLNKKEVELSRQTESEDQFSTHLRKANRQLEIFEGKVEVARQHECALTKENRRLRQLLNDMILDRAVFNHYWFKLVGNLGNRRMFLLDMIERSSQAFNQGADFLDNLKQLQSRRSMDREFHISEMVNMERQIDANEIMSMFLGGKGKRREIASLEPREIRRRDNFKGEYSSRINFYNEIIANIKKFTGKQDIMNSIEVYMSEENEGFQLYNYVNEVNHEIDYFTHNFFKISTTIKNSKDYNDRRQQYYDQRIDQLNKEFDVEINKTLKLKNERENVDHEVEQYLNTIFEIMKMFECDFAPVEDLLGDHSKITVHNVDKFLSILEQRTNEILAFVYCDERKDLFKEDPTLTVKSFKRPVEEPIKITAIITKQQCGECAESEEVNRYDDKIVHPLDEEEIKSKMREKVETPEIEFRLHNLSKCNLPHSGVVTGRRYAE